MQIDLQAIGLNQAIIDQLTSGYQNFGPQTPFSDWRQAANDLASEADIAAREAQLRNQIDPGRGSAIGRGTFRDVAKEELVDQPNAAAWMDTYTSQGLPPYKVNEQGQKVYINTPKGVNLVDLLQGADREEYLAMKKAGFDERLTKTPYNVQSGLYGSGAGNYGTTVVPEELNNFQKALSSPIVSALAAFIPGGSLALVAGKTLADVDVSPVEIALAAHGAYGDYAKSIANKAVEETGGQAVEQTIDIKLTTPEQQAVAIQQTPIDVIDLAGDPSAFAGLDIAGLTPEAAQTVSDIQYRVVDAIGADSFEKMDSAALRRELVKRGDTEGLAAFGLTERTEGFFPSFTDLRQDVLQEYITSTGPAFAPDVIGGRTTDSLLIDRPPVVREYKIEDLLTEPERTTPVRPQPTQTPGGGGGAPSAAASAPTATTVTAPAAPSATITPTVLPPMLTAPGSVTNALLTNTLSALASASAVSTPSQQPTVAPPVTPVATTAPTPEPTPPTTTEPTDILEDTTAEDTASQIEAEQQAQAEAAREAQAAREAEAARLAEEARKASEARAAAEAKAAAEQEAIAQAEARAVAAEARLAEQQAQAQADAAAAEAARAANAQAQADALAEAVAAGEARYGEAVAAGEALGEAQYGEGLGTGRGQGAGAGIGAGLGLGLLSGMLGGQGGTGGYTPPDFEDYQFRKTYQAPELLELAPQYEGYQAPVFQGLFRNIV
jgi:hypothetical protein